MKGGGGGGGGACVGYVTDRELYLIFSQPMRLFSFCHLFCCLFVVVVFEVGGWEGVVRNVSQGGFPPLSPLRCIKFEPEN